ncbi:MAG: hypothetical protein HY712_00040 [candidate division NC10 bacterium]|nr:hypothetical protein [candidate division NC10 bacterium]
MAEITQDADDVKKTVSRPLAAGRGNGLGETYCPICGRDATDPSLKRFGEFFCSEAHVAAYAREIRLKQATEAAALATVAGAATTTPPATGTPDVAQTPQKQGGISGFLKMAACCGGMLLLLPALGLVSVGGLAAVAGSALSVVAVLACPIGMYLMMRMMMKQEKHPGQGRDADADPKQLPPKGSEPLG